MLFSGRIVLLLISFGLRANCLDSDLPKVKVAVYEHNVTVPPNVTGIVQRSTAVHNVMINLEVLRKRTEEASRQGAKLIVLPEYGILAPIRLGGLDKIKINPYLEYMPDPRTESWNPCDDSSRHPNSDVQIFLSCMAKNNSIYVVANYGDRQPCNLTGDPDCPATGQFQYNTDIVYDSVGNFVAKYHKKWLFFEYHFDTPKHADVVTFDTPFGTFGVFTCFDILFHDPAIDMIQNHGIKNIAFPTAWMDQLPFFSSIEFHSAFAAGWGINFLASNLHIPSHGFQGSGIYTPSGAAAHYYNDQTNEGRLLIAEIPVINNTTNTHYPFKVRSFENKRTISKSKSGTETEFQSSLFHDQFNMIPLDYLSNETTICHNQLCCHISYNRSRDDELFAFGAFDGLHTYEGRYYLQICTMIKCRNATYSSCSLKTKSSNTHFYDVEITGNFSTEYIYPEVLLSRENAQLALSAADTWYHKAGTLTINRTLEYPLLSATLFSRIYSRDNENLQHSQQHSHANKLASYKISFMFVVIGLVFVSVNSQGH